MKWHGKYFWIGRGLMAPADDSGAEGSGTVEESSGGPTPSSGESDASPAVAAAAPEATQEAGDAQGEAPQPQQAQPQWYHKRIDTLTRRLRETEEALRSVRQSQEQVASATQAGGDVPSQPAALGEAEIQRRAAELVQMQDFNRRANEVWETGQRELPNFQESVRSLQQMAGGELPVAFVTAVLELDAPAKVLDALAKNQDLAYQVIHEPNLVKQTAALAKFERKLGEAKPSVQVSKAPPPVIPQAGGRVAAPTPSEYDTDLPIQQWMALRNKR